MPLAWPCWCRRLSLQEVRFLCCRSLRSSPGTPYCREEEEEEGEGEVEGEVEEEGEEEETVLLHFL